MPITVVGTFADGSGQFSETVDAVDSADAERIVRRLLAPRELHVAGFFDYGSTSGNFSDGVLTEGGAGGVDAGLDDPPDHEIEEAEDRSGWY
ncbi:MAG TPA: hypothetical protein VGW38_08235 [Chloroflexota bacterium]|nr:hypothetical protein [Chloroflexota bacterium]